jgi:hypothetical protein
MMRRIIGIACIALSLTGCVALVDPFTGATVIGPPVVAAPPVVVAPRYHYWGGGWRNQGWQGRGGGGWHHR